MTSSSTTDTDGRRSSSRWRLAARTGDDRGTVAAAVVLFPVFAAAVFMAIQAVAWQHDRQVAAAAADRAGAAVALYGASPGEAEAATTAAMTSAGMSNVSVSITQGSTSTVVRVSGTAPGLLSGMSVTVTAESVTPTERWSPP